MNPLLSNIQNKLNFREKESYIYGTYNNFDMNITVNSDSQGEIIIFIPVNIIGPKGSLYDYIDLMKSQLALSDYKIGENSLVLVYSERNKVTNEVDFIINLVKILNEIDCSKSCLVCKESKDSQFYYVNDTVTHLCDICSETIKNNISHEKEKPDNYFVGFIGAIIGGFVGSIVWILLGFLNFYASFAGFVIAYAAFGGYNFFKARPSKIGALINILAIIISILFAEYIGLMIQFLKEYSELSVSQFLAITPRLFSDSGFISAILPNIGLGFLFAGLGSFRIIINMFNNSQEKSDLIFEKI